ncbi:MAG: LacI family DNA-binding transcriptional regulator [Chloroflexi bacterium]|nr:LacI family DNA-binding transcriptional regulator [Chloroflexota bacterium]
MKNRVSMRDVARAAGVAIATVSLVVHGQPGVSPATKRHVLEAVKQLGYSMPAASYPTQNQTVGLLIEKSAMPVMLDIFYGAVISGFQSEAQRQGFQVFLYMFDREKNNLESLRSQLTENVRGLVIANDGDVNSEMVIQLEALKLPLVLIENYVQGHELPCILGDNYTAGYMAMAHLLSLGHRSIAVLPGPTKYSSLQDRLRGCLAAAAEAGLLIPAERMPQSHSHHAKKGYFEMQEILRLPERPTGVVAISDKTAFGAMEAIKEAGLKIPGDIAIVSIDDVAEAAQANPPLTTVHIPKYEMGVLAMQKLQQLINEGSTLAVKSVLYAKLVVRASSGGPV